MSNEAVISGGLNALMLLQRGMEEMQKNPPAQQGPAGPTVAMQAQQAAQQAVAGQPPQDPSAPPPPGQPQPQENGIAGIAQNVGTGAQIQAQQQQQAQQAMMAQAQQAQRQPQQMASGGIAGLNAQNMQGFKEGGVLGFAGPDGSDVPSAEELEAASKAAGLLRQTFEKPSENVDLQRAKAEAARANAVLNQYGSIKKQNDPQGLLLAQQDADAARKELLSIVASQFDSINKSKDTRETKKEGAIQNERLTSNPSVESEASLELQRRPIDFGVGKGFDDEAKAPVSQGRPAGPVAPKVPTSQSDLEGLMAAYTKGRGAVPDTDLSEQRRLNAEIKAARAAQPNVGIEQLAAYRRAQEEYDTAAKERKESFGSRQFRELMRDMSMNRNGEGMARVGEEERKLTEADTTRRLTNAQLSGHIVDAQNARAVGDLEKELASTNAITAILQKDAEHKAKAGESIASSFGHIAQQRISADSSAANNATQMAIARMKIEQEKANNDILKQDQSYNGFQRSIEGNERNRTLRLGEADKAFDATSKKTLLMLDNGSKEDKDKAEDIRAGHNKLLQGINNSFNEMLNKIEMQQWRRHGEAMGLPKPSTAAATAGGNRIKLDQLR
jgi:hypothetical protein